MSLLWLQKAVHMSECTNKKLPFDTVLNAMKNLKRAEISTTFADFEQVWFF